MGPGFISRLNGRVGQQLPVRVAREGAERSPLRWGFDLLMTTLTCRIESLVAMNDDSLNIPRKKRASSPSVVDRMAVRKALSGVAKPIENLQNEVAFFRALAARGSVDTVAAQGKRLQGHLTTLEQQLNALVDQLPEQLKTHGRVMDLRNALSSAQSSMADALQHRRDA